MSETAAPERPERELAQRFEHLRLVLEVARIATWERDLQTDRSTWSAYGEQLYGLPSGTFEGTYQAFLEVVHPDDRARLQQRAAEAIAAGTDYGVEFRVVWPDGSVHWIDARARVARDLAGRPVRLIGIAQEITERKRTEEALRDSEERYRSIVQTANEGIWLLDTTAHTLYVNDRMAAMLDYPTAELARRPVLDFCFPEDRDWAWERVERNLRGEAEQFNARFRRRDGTELLVLACTSAVRGARGEIVGALGLFTDVTARRQGEAERARLMAQERAAREEAEAAVRARDEFLSIAAHELLTPVTALKGHTQMLQRAQARGPIEPERLARVLATLAEGCDRLTALMRDLLDVSRLRTGRMPLRPQPLDLVGFVRDAAALYRDQLQVAHALIVEESDAVCPVVVDRDRLGQVLANLLSNAAKYSPDGGTIRVRVRPDGDGARLEVQDEGIGLPPGTAESIFQPFGRARNAAERQVPGMGLGLYISRQIVEQHGGRVWASSPGEGQGTTFFVWLPCQPADDAASSAPSRG